MLQSFQKAPLDHPVTILMDIDALILTWTEYINALSMIIQQKKYLLCTGEYSLPRSERIE